MPILLNGTEAAAHIKEELRQQAIIWNKDKGMPFPHLAIVLVGNNPASETYIKNKMKACEKIGFITTLLRLEEEISEEELIQHIDFLNTNKEINGVIVQSPLPEHINAKRVVESISPMKDVDGFHPINIGRMALRLPAFKPATPYGIDLLLRHYNIATQGKKCVIVGRSNIVGLPLSIMLGLNKEYANCTVTLCHSKTKDLIQHTQSADILITAMGQPKFITEEMVKPKAIVIDVGITRIPSEDGDKPYILCGDVDFEKVASKCSYITPVPGGVGPMTIAALLKNTMRAAKLQL